MGTDPRVCDLMTRPLGQNRYSAVSLRPKSGFHRQKAPPTASLHWHMREQIADALPIVCPSDRLRDCAADVDDTELGTAFQLVGQRDRIRDDNLREATLV